MLSKLRQLYLLAAALVASVSTISAYEVAIVRDGPSWYFEHLNEIFQKELSQLSGAQTAPTFTEIPVEPYNFQSIEAAVEAAIASEQYAAVYTCGIIATRISQTLAQESGSMPKPVVAGSLQLSEVESDLVSPQGTSQIKNFTPIIVPQRVPSDLAQLAEISGAQTLHILVDAHYLAALDKNIEANQQMLQSQLGVDVFLVAASANLEATLGNIPADAEAVYVSILDRFDTAYRSELYQKLKDRGLPTLAMIGRPEVELGALLGLAQFNYEQIARRSAVNLHLMLGGTPASSLPVFLPAQDRLVLNMQTADAIGFAPDYNTSLSAEILHLDSAQQAQEITIETAMDRALEGNISIEIAARTTEISEFGVEIARSPLLPQISASGSGNHTEFYSAPAGAIDYSQSASLGIQLRQVLYSEKAWAGLEIQRNLLSASKMDLRSSQLDAYQSAARAYLACLSAEALYQIERNNLNLTRDTVQLARLRIDIGASQASELFRWEQQLARGKAVLIQRETARLNAVAQLNRILGVPQSTSWIFKDIDVGDKELYFLNDRLSPIIKNIRDFRNFVQYTSKLAIQNSPELAAFDLQLLAQGIELQSLKRDFYLPEVSMSGQLSRNYSENNQADWDGQNQASLGLSVSIPIFEGGSRISQVRQQRSSIARLEAQRLATVQQLEEAAINATNAIRSGHPNIRLNRKALEAAEANYTSVTERYAQGEASFLDIIDAQQALLSQQQTLATATYDYLAAVYNLQRSIAWFEHAKSDTEQAAWISDFQNFIQSQL